MHNDRVFLDTSHMLSPFQRRNFKYKNVRNYNNLYDE